MMIQNFIFVESLEEEKDFLGVLLPLIALSTVAWFICFHFWQEIFL